MQLGRFRVEAVSWGDLEGVCTLTLADRMAQVADEALVAPYAPLGLHPSDAAKALVYDVFGAAIAYTVETTPAAETILGDAVYVDDRAAAISDLAAAADAWAYFDNLGGWRLRPRSSSAPGWCGPSPRARAGPSSTRRNPWSGRPSVTASWSAGRRPPTPPPVSYLATFDDPASPLRWGGPFGRVALVADSQSVTTAAQAQAVAESLLRLRLGLARTLVLRLAPNPALEPDDLIAVAFPDGRVEQHTVNAVRDRPRPGRRYGADGDVDDRRVGRPDRPRRHHPGAAVAAGRGVSTRVPYTRTLPVVLRERLDELDRIQLLAARVTAVPDARHVTVSYGGATVTIPRLASYAAAVNDTAQVLAQGSVMLALGTVK